ncbi:MAG: type II toxin-antitoxin system HipA family toxin [Gammaproteobacteria bacterium]|nr:type II toxin-antitoxin system HipA family toxin [Gammaproteobacteria bacterium]
MDSIAVELWGERIGVLSWVEESGYAEFQYEPTFVQNGIDLSPVHLPLSNQVFRFPEHTQSNTFRGLPGFIADSLPEKFGNRLLDTYLAKHGRRLEALNPLERLCYIGNRGMGALEYQPDLETRDLNNSIPLEVSDLVQVARDVLKDYQGANADIENDGIETLVAVGTSAGGAKAKAVIAISDDSDQVLSGQATAPDGFEHWLLKFDEIDNEELATSKQIGRIEYAYSEMAFQAGINMMECRLLSDGPQAHFMTKRFDRVDGNAKVHVVTFAGMEHADRDPPGHVGYERLFQTMREIGLPQSDLTEMYRRMLFNICARNQDDHTKNHAFLMFSDGAWQLSPAYDICFSYKPGNPFIEQHQMSCNGKRDDFEIEDLMGAATSADVKRPREILSDIETAIAKWPIYAEQAGLSEILTTEIGSLHRKFLSK